jgi:acyl-CoA dehydrogenase
MIIMDFNFSEDENVFREMVKELASKYIAPRVKEIEEKGQIPKEIINALASQGLLGLTISPNYGGAGASITMATIAAEEIAYADISVATAVYYLLNAGWPMILERYASEEVKEEILPNITHGETFFGIAVTEPSGGSDVAGIKTNAVKKGNKWIINGEKVYISGVRESLELPKGGGMLLLTRTGGNELGYKAFTSFAFLLKKPDGSITNGVTPTFFEDIGRRGISTGGFALKDVEIDDKYRIGDEGKGFYIIMEGFNVARTLVAAACIGAARRALDIGMDYIKQRILFEQPIAKFEAIQFELVDDYARLEAAKLFTYRAAWLLDRFYKGDKSVSVSDINKYVAMAKMTAPQVAYDIFTHVMLWHGAYAYTKESELGIGLTGVLSYLIGAEGTMNIMKTIVGRELLGREYSVTTRWAGKKG